MKKKTTKKTMKPKAKKMSCEVKTGCSGACGGAIYGLGLIGALVYYVSTATGFWNGVLGVIKALVWPAFLVFELMKYLGM